MYNPYDEGYQPGPGAQYNGRHNNGYDPAHFAQGSQNSGCGAVQRSAEAGYVPYEGSTPQTMYAWGQSPPQSLFPGAVQAQPQMGMPPQPQQWQQQCNSCGGSGISYGPPG